MESSWNKLIKSFGYAFEGIRTGFKERNRKIHGMMSLVVVVEGIIWKITLGEWIVVLMLVAMVWSAELMNSSIEEIANLMKETHKYNYQKTKATRDMAAGSVLVTAIAAAIIGMIIFVTRTLQ